MSNTPRDGGLALTLCRRCQVAAGFWNPADPLCPACWAATQEADQ